MAFIGYFKAVRDQLLQVTYSGCIPTEDDTHGMFMDDGSAGTFTYTASTGDVKIDCDRYTYIYKPDGATYYIGGNLA